MKNQDDHEHTPDMGAFDREEPSPLVLKILAHLGLSDINVAQCIPEEILMMALKDIFWEKRVSAVKAIGEMKGEKCIELLVGALQDTHRAVRAIAAKALGDLGELAPVESLLAILQDSCWEVRTEGAYALGKMETRRVPQGPLIQLLQDKDAAVRAAAVWALGRRGKLSPLEQLVEVFLQDQEWEVRTATVFALGELKAWAHLQELFSQLEDEDEQVLQAFKIVLQQRDGESERTYKLDASINISAGQKLGQYVLVEQIGRGGRAQVFLAEHCILKRKTAIKIPLSSKVHQATFLEEAQILAQLRHPHILHVYDANVEQGVPYIVTDYIAGGTLRSRYSLEIGLPVKQTIAYIKALADALEYAHNNGVIHGDVKPENVLIGTEGEIILCDFGLATNLKSLYSHSTITGTHRYMAPERFKKRNSPASDQFALAVIAWELLNGMHPFGGATDKEMVHKICHEPPLQSYLSSRAQTVLLKALSKAPQQRFDSIANFAMALESSLQDTEFLRIELLGGDQSNPCYSPREVTTEHILKPCDTSPLP